MPYLILGKHNGIEKVEVDSWSVFILFSDINTDTAFLSSDVVSMLFIGYFR